VRLVAGSSRDEGRRRRFEAAHPNVRTYTRWKDLLKSEKLDIVGVATHSPYHAEITVACAEAGVRAVLCEKPIATRLSDADRAIRACREHQTILAINHNRRWNPLWRAVRDEIRKGTIGDVYHAMVHWPTGRLGNVGTHMFDALRMLLGSDATHVSGTLDPVVAPDCRGPQYHDPGGWGIVTFANSARAFIDASQTAKLPMGVRIVGSLGQIRIQRNDAAVELWEGGTSVIAPPRNGLTSMHIAVQDIVTSMTDGGEPASTGEDGLAALEIIIGFHVSDRMQSQRVALPIADVNRNLEVAIG
jgi:predicted dehydrogenase